MQPQFSVDSNGMVIGLRIHDGWLRGIEDVPDGGLLIKCRRIDGGNVTLNFKDASLLRVAEFVLGNIIDSVFQWPVHLVPDYAKDFLLWNLGEDAPNFWERLSAEHSDSYVFTVECSYGATVALIAKGLDIAEEAVPSTPLQHSQWATP